MKRCDGNHGGLPCDDPECWQRACLEFIPAFVHTRGHLCAVFDTVTASSLEQAARTPPMRQHGPNGQMCIVGISTRIDEDLIIRRPAE